MRIVGLGMMVAALVVSAPAMAAPTIGGGGCATDLSLTAGSTLVNCYGRFDNNILNNSNNASINSALTQLGYAGPAITFDDLPGTSKLSGLNGANPNFPGLLNGTIYVGIHFGNGQGGPGNTTTFYKITASNLDVIGLNLRASSNAVLFASVPGSVPEPATWGMMIAGFGLIGAGLRRRAAGAALA